MALREVDYDPFQPQADYGALIDRYADDEGVPRPLAKALFKQESGFNPRAVNASTGATGLGQLMPTTAEALGVTDRTDPEQNVRASMKYLREGYDKHGTPRDALRYYYGGPNKKQWGEKTNRYPDDVLKHVAPEERSGMAFGKKSGLVEVDYDPFAGDKAPGLVEVDYDPFADTKPKEKPGILSRVLSAISTPSATEPYDAEEPSNTLEPATPTAPPALAAAPKPALRGSVMQDYPAGQLPAGAGVPDGMARDILTRPKDEFKSTFDWDTHDKYKDANPAVRGVVKGGKIGAQGMAGLAQAGADFVGADGVGDVMRQTGRGLESDIQAMGEAKGDMNRNLEGAISSIVSQGGGYVLGGAVKPLLHIGAQVFGQEYAEGTRAGQSGGDAAARAAAFATAEIVGERLGMPSFMKVFKQSFAGAPTEELIPLLAKHIAREVPGEVLTTTLQFGVDKASPVGLTPEATLNDYLAQVKDTVVQTVMQAGMVSGSALGVAAGVRKYGEVNSTNAADKARDEALSKWAGLSDLIRNTRKPEATNERPLDDAGTTGAAPQPTQAGLEGAPALDLGGDQQNQINQAQAEPEQQGTQPQEAIYKTDGTPFANEKSALLAAKRQGKEGAEIVPVEGGFVIRPAVSHETSAVEPTVEPIIEPPVADRRADATQRKIVADMTPEERATALLTSEVTGIPNRRAFDDDETQSKAPVIGYADGDNFKAVNTALGHEEADKVLREMGSIFDEAARQTGAKAYHRSGDEFLFRYDSPDQEGAFRKAVEEISANKVLHLTDPQGNTYEYRSPKFSIGAGRDINVAETDANFAKQERIATGERSGTGQAPRGFSRVTAARNQNNGDNLQREVQAPVSQGQVNVQDQIRQAGGTPFLGGALPGGEQTAIQGRNDNKGRPSSQGDINAIPARGAPSAQETVEQTTDLARPDGSTRTFKSETKAKAFASGKTAEGYTPREVAKDKWVLSRIKKPRTPAQAAVDAEDSSIKSAAVDSGSNKGTANRLLARPQLGGDLRKGEAGQSQLGGGIDINEVPGGLINADVSELPNNSALVDAELLSNLSKSEAFLSEGFGGMDIPDGEKVFSSVIALGKNLKVREAIIKAIPVDMMNVLIGRKLSPEMLFHDISVLKDFLSPNRESYISSGGDPTIAGRFIGLAAKAATEVGISERRGFTAGDTLGVKHDVTPISDVVLGDAKAATSAPPPTIPENAKTLNAPPNEGRGVSGVEKISPENNPKNQGELAPQLKETTPSLTKPEANEREVDTSPVVSIKSIPKSFLKRIQVDMPVLEADGSVSIEKRAAKDALASLARQEKAYTTLRKCMG